jgi:hypothetical protein
VQFSGTEAEDVAKEAAKKETEQAMLREKHPEWFTHLVEEATKKPKRKSRKKPR